MSISPSTNKWPKHLRVGSLRVVRSSAHYEATIAFYRDLVGLPVIDEFHDSYGEDGTIFGLPSWQRHLEIVRSRDGEVRVAEFDQLVFYLEDAAAVDAATQPLRANGIRPVRKQHPYWDDNGGVTFLDPDGRGVVFVSWVYGPWLDN